jgi:hypothetical protein
MFKLERAFAIYGIDKRLERAKRRALSRFRVLRRRLPEQKRKLRVLVRWKTVAQRAKRRAVSRFRILRRRLPEQKRKLRVFFMMQRVRWKIVAQRYAVRTRDYALRGSATLLSCIPIAYLSAFGGEAGKASEAHLTAAQIIGAALALVLSLSIIPAQRAAELLSMPILRLFARDFALVTVFLVLVATTAASVFLGSAAVDISSRWALAIQFLLLGVSFDALRQFYSRVLDLLIPSTAIELVVSVCEKLVAQASIAVEKLLEIQTASGMSDQSRAATSAILFANSHVPPEFEFLDRATRRVCS